MKRPPVDPRFAQPEDLDPALAESVAAIERERIEGAGAAIADLEALDQGRKRLLRPNESLIRRPNGRS
jgi:hypothetical protein